MRIAVPTFRDQVSPRFDCAENALLADVDDDNSFTTELLELGDSEPSRRIQILRNANVDVVICGNIDRLSRELISDSISKIVC